MTNVPPWRLMRAFRPLLRVYEPADAIFDGTYELPPITRVTCG